MWLLSAEALACGGFFCDGGGGNTTTTTSQVAIQQAAENIAFKLDDGIVEMCVQVYYEGGADDFAWVVPVPGVPEITTTGDTFFDELNRVTAPIFRTTRSTNGQCSGGSYSYGGSGYYYYGYSGSYSTGSGTVPDETDTPAVTVLASGQVGPYDTVILESESSEALVTWLQDHDFDVPSSLDTAIAPYVAEGQKLAALRLSAGESTDHVRPVCLSWPGAQASIPIRLTSVAAAPGMGVTVWVFGEHRAVPLSYYHVVPNDLAIDWWSGNLNYYDIVARAADEAGGHGFATDRSSPNTGLTDFGDTLASYEVGASLLDLAPDAVAWGEVAVDRFPLNSDLLGILRTWLPKPADATVDDETFYGCLSCFATSADFPTFDAVAATAEVRATLIAGMARLAEWRGATAHYTRLTSSLDASEMTVDPTFGLNPHMSPVVNGLRDLDDRADCDSGQDDADADRDVTWPSGFSARLPSENDLAALGIPEIAYLGSLGALASSRIESTAEICEPLIVTDNAASLLEAGSGYQLDGHVMTEGEIAAWNADVEACRANGGPLPSEGEGEGDDSGCGCRASPRGAGPAVALLLGLVVRRRVYRRPSR